MAKKPWWTNEVRAASELKPYDKNPKSHSPQQVEAIARSMREFGYAAPVIIDDRGMILAGHARQLAALLPGMEAFAEKLDVRVGHALSADQKRAYVITDNRLTELGEWNRDLLKFELASLADAGFDLDLTGFSLDDFAGGPGLTDPDAAPEPPKIPATRVGDLWLLGKHRVLAGDATASDEVRRLLAGGPSPRLMVTDPPYGVNYDPRWRARAGVNLNGKKLGKVANDDRADWRQAWSLFPGAVAYCWHGGLHSSESEVALAASGFQIRAQIIWVKDRFALSRGDYHWQHEPCWYAVRKGVPGRWVGNRSQSTTWVIPAREDVGHGHGTQKPVECMRRPIVNNSVKGEAVYDPFVGSGTTIIAAEMEGRHCLAIDLDPVYVDVAVLRWQAFTGKEATLEGDGRTFADLAAERAKKRPRSRLRGRASKPAEDQPAGVP